MDKYKISKIIKEQREKNNLTQVELAEILNVSDKTISKWETANGYPDISLFEPLSKALNISILELFNGDVINNTNTNSNVLKSKIYCCPICNNIIYSMGEITLSCHGIELTPLQVEEPNELHAINIEKVEDEYYISINHDMNKLHYIVFVMGIYIDRTEIIKLYPESLAETRLKVRGLRKILYYCNKDGLYEYDIRKNRIIK